MNWYKAKTILIIFLAVVNIALFTYIIYDSVQSRKTEATVFDTVIELLDKNNISVDKSVIDKTHAPKSLKNIYTKNIISSYEEFAKLLLGKNVKSIGENVYSNETENAKITFLGDWFNVEAEPGNIMMYTESKDELKTSKELLSAMGIDVSSIKYEITKNGLETVIKFEEYINNYPVFGTGITVTFSDGMITSMNGCWFIKEGKENQSTELKNLSGVLIDYMNKLSPLADRRTVSDICFGYAIHEADQYHKEIILTPSWQIIDDLGNTEILDARENL